MININNLTKVEREEMEKKLEGAINVYLETKKDEILFNYITMDFHINANENQIIDAIFDIVSHELSIELKKSFDASLIEGNETIDIIVMEYLEKLFKIN